MIPRVSLLQGTLQVGQTVTADISGVSDTDNFRAGHLLIHIHGRVHLTTAPGLKSEPPPLMN